MPEIFPESAPGNFTWNEEMKRWVMTVFHNYQCDLNFSNPKVLQAMVETMPSMPPSMVSTTDRTASLYAT